MQVGDLVKQIDMIGLGIIIRIAKEGVGVLWNDGFCFVPMGHLEVISASR